MSVQIPDDFGYVILVFTLSVFVNFWHGMRVGLYRRVAKVDYPATYQLTFENGKINQDNKFNCYQRSHQNFSENYASVMIGMILGGLKHPVVAAVGGLVWLVGRVVYALGYQTGNPKLRARGFFGYFGLLAILITMISAGISMIPFSAALGPVLAGKGL
jgi:glutathione S-transferase